MSESAILDNFFYNFQLIYLQYDKVKKYTSDAKYGMFISFINVYCICAKTRNFKTYWKNNIL